jgi:acetyltransferase-like isoleucine patch superfamily enzyme
MSGKPDHPQLPAEDREAWIAAARASFQQLREEFRTRFSRDLPLEEMLFDRWERAASLGFGPKTSIHHNSYVYGDVTVGENTWIGPFTLLDGSGGLKIGSACSISAGVQIYTHDTVKWAVSGGKLPYERAPVVIGDACHIGASVVITKGVTIGAHSVIGSCAFVNRDVPPFTVAFGVPCRPRGRVFIEDDGSVRLEMDDASVAGAGA